VEIDTTRFGNIDIDETKIIEMRGAIIGFEHLRKYILLHTKDEKSPYSWFQSLEDGAIAFVVINPYVVKSDYKPLISDNDAVLLEIENAEDVVLLAIATIRQAPFSVSVNLKAPLVINSKKKVGKQVVLEDHAYPIQYFLTPDSGNEISARRDSTNSRDSGEVSP